MKNFKTPMYYEYFRCQRQLWDCVTTPLGYLGDKNLNCAIKNELNQKLRFAHGSIVQRIRWMNSSYFSPDE